MTGQLADPLSRFAHEKPGQLALVTGSGEAFSALELDRAAEYFASELVRLGASAGTVVALEGKPGPTWLAALAGCWRLGAIAAPLNHRLPASENELAAQTMGCDMRWTPSEELFPNTIAASPVNIPVEWSPDRPLIRVCTSGSTGAPRCVELLASQLHSSALASTERLGHQSSDRWLVCLPVNHVGALAAIYRCLHNQVTLELHPGYDGATVARRLDSGEISLVSLVPSMLEDILNTRGEQSFPASLRVILLGGAACGESLLDRCRPASLPVALTWGMTEAASQLATRVPGDLSPLDEGLPPLSCVSVEVDASGRLVVDSPMSRGRLVTTDMGELTPSGRVRILGRSDDLIIRGGENMYPGEIENVLRLHPGVTDAVVLPQADTRLGQVPVALVQAGDIDVESLRDWCREHLAGFKIPARFIAIDEMPRTSAGKVDRQRLKERLNVQ